MTDMVNGMTQNQEVSQTQPAEMNVNEHPVSTGNERVFRQSEVNELIKKVKVGAVEDYKRLQSQQPQYAQEKYGDSNAYTNLMPEDKLQHMIEEAAGRHIEKVREEAYLNYQRETAQRIVDNFRQKTQSGREKFEDFETVTGDVEMAHFPNVVEILSEHVDNADEVYYELSKDLLKMATIEELGKKTKASAIKAVKNFANSLKENANAKRYRQPNEPLSQMHPSNTGTDVGAMSVKDYRKKYRV